MSKEEKNTQQSEEKNSPKDSQKVAPVRKVGRPKKSVSAEASVSTKASSDTSTRQGSPAEEKKKVDVKAKEQKVEKKPRAIVKNAEVEEQKVDAKPKEQKKINIMQSVDTTVSKDQSLQKDDIPQQLQQQAQQTPRQQQQRRPQQTGGYQQRRPQQRDYHGQQQRRDNSNRRQQPYQQQRNRQFDKQKDDRPLEELSFYELGNFARRLGIIGAGLMKKDALLERIKYVQAHPDLEMEVTGVLEKLPDGFGFLRSADYDYVSGPDDVYVSPSQIRYCGLRTGDVVTGIVRKPRDAERYFALYKVTKIDGKLPEEVRDRPYFDRLTPKHPDHRMTLEYDQHSIATRIMDMFTPVGKGQRGLIVAPPKVGKTVLLKNLALSLLAEDKDRHLIIFLVDERPEEVADMKKTITGLNVKIVSSTFDESAERHVQVANIIIEKAKRMVEMGTDVVVLLDSITRLARAYNTVAPASGKILTGGIDANALQKPKRFFGAARATEEAGSLTILATALVDTGSRMDEVIYEEFKGTGNMEMHMTRKLANRRIFPALDLLVSGTRRDDLLQTPEDLNKVWVLQKFLATMSTQEGMEFLKDKLKKFKTNREFLDSINKREGNGKGK